MVDIALEGRVKWWKKPFVTQLELYSSIKELPIERYQEFNKLACIDIGIGSQIKDFNGHFTTLHAYLSENKVSEAIQETKNLHNGFWYMIEKVGIWSYCFCAFIKSVNGKEYKGTELEDHKEMISYLSKKGLRTGQCQDLIDDVKKNLIQNLNATFLIDSMKLDQLTRYQN